MKYFKAFLSAFLFINIPLLGATSYFSIRSQSEDSARELVGWSNFVNLYNMEQFYGVFAITPEYTASISPHDIIECLFGMVSCDKDCHLITVSGSRVENRGTFDWLADYFGLPTDFKSEIHLEPRVYNSLIDFNLYLGLDNWYEGLFFRIHAPVVHTKWNLNFCETVSSIGVAPYVEGYFTPNTVDRSNLLTNFSEFIQQGNAPKLGDGIEFRPLRNCLWPCCALTATKLSDIQTAFGWNFIQNPDYHFGIAARFAAPTGTRADGNLLFEPIIGNGHHWEVGFGITSHAILWRNVEETQHLGAYIDANITHLTKTQQCRCFDVRPSGVNSKYVLAQKLGVPVSNLFANEEDDMAGGNQPSAQFKNVFTPVANLTHLPVNVNSAIQVDLTVMFNLTAKNFSWDLGYNLWARTCEKICFNCDCATPLDNSRTWAIKGDAHVFGFAATTFGGVNENEPVALSGTQSKATISRGTNNFVGPLGIEGGIDDIRPTRNPGVDNAQFALFSNDQSMDAFFLLDRRTPTGLQTKTSSDLIATSNGESKIVSRAPVFLNRGSIDLKGSRTKGLAHKIFTHFSFSWHATEHVIPYLGIGMKIEFTSPERLCDEILSRCFSCAAGCLNCEQSCHDCQRCSLSEWGVWLKGGFAFQ